MFSLEHLLYASMALLVMMSLVVGFRNKPMTFWLKLITYVGIVSETIKVVSYVAANESVYQGYLPKTDLPFQLCSIQLIFIAILNLSKNPKVHRVLYGFMMPSCLLGGFAAILIPTSSSLTMPSITVQYFTYHAVIMAFAIHMMIHKELEWTLHDYSNTMKMLGLFGFIAVYLNSMCYDVVDYSTENGTKVVSYVSRVNFMYIVDPPVKGLPLLNKDHGWIVYLIHFGFVASFLVTLVYIKPIVVSLREGRREKKEARDCQSVF